MPCDNSLDRVLDTVRVGVPAVSLDHLQPSNNYVYRLHYSSIPVIGPRSPFVHFALFLCSIYVLLLNVIKRLAYSIDKDRVLCEVGAECQCAKGQWDARASRRNRRTGHVLSSNVKPSNVRKTAVFHDGIP